MSRSFEDNMATLITNSVQLKTFLSETKFLVDDLISQTPVEKREKARELMTWLRGMSIDLGHLEGVITELTNDA